MQLLPSPWKALNILLTLRGNHMTEHVERANKWAYFAQNVAWLISVPVAITLIYCNLSARVDSQEKEIAGLRQTINDNNTQITARLDKVDKTQEEQLRVMIELKTIVEGVPHGQYQSQTAH